MVLALSKRDAYEILKMYTTGMATWATETATATATRWFLRTEIRRKRGNDGGTRPPFLAASLNLDRRASASSARQIILKQRGSHGALVL